MRLHPNQLGKFAAAAACAALLIGLASCEKEQVQADKRVKADLAESRDIVRGAVKTVAEPQRDEQAYLRLKAAAQENKASPAARANAKAAFAQANYVRGNSYVPAINSSEAEASLALYEIEHLTARVAAQLPAIAAQQGSNPDTDDANSPKKAYLKNKEIHIGESGAAAKKMEDLTKQIAAQAAAIKDLDQKRAAAFDAAKTLMDQSERTRAEESVRLHAQSLEKQQEGQNFDARLFGERIALQRLQADLESATKAKAAADKAAEEDQKMAEEIDKRWQKTRDMTKLREDEAKAIAASIQTGATSRPSALPQFTAAFAEANRQREKAAEYYKLAVDYFDQAVRQATDVGNEMGKQLRDQANTEAPGRRAWQGLQKVYDPGKFRVAKARASQALGMLYLQEKMLLEKQKNTAEGMAAVFASAKLTPPLAPPTQQEIDAAAKKAVEALKVADDELAAVPDTSDPALRTEASLLRVAVLYAMFSATGDQKAFTGAVNELINVAQANQSMTFPLYAADLEAAVRAKVNLHPGTAAPSTINNTPTPTPPTTAPAPTDGNVETTTPTTNPIVPPPPSDPATPPAAGDAPVTPPATAPTNP
jgi:hypothetical protein